MIKVTSLQKAEFVVNADLIEFIESTPDTLISLTNGKKIMVSESIDEVLNRVVRYRHKIAIGSPKGKRNKRPYQLKDRYTWTSQR